MEWQRWNKNKSVDGCWSWVTVRTCGSLHPLLLYLFGSLPNKKGRNENKYLAKIKNGNIHLAEVQEKEQTYFSAEQFSNMTQMSFQILYFTFKVYF